MDEFKFIDEEEKAKDRLLAEKIKLLSAQRGLEEIAYDASFVVAPHFYILTKNLDRDIEIEAFKIFENIFVPIKP